MSIRLFVPLLSVALIVMGCTSAGGSDDEAALRHLKEVEWPRAYREQDVALLDRILAEEFLRIDAEGSWSSKADELAYIKTHKPGYETFRFDIKRLEIFGKDTAIVAGTGHMTGTDAEGRYAVEYQSTNTLIRRRGIWKAIASHVSGVKRTRL